MKRMIWPVLAAAALSACNSMGGVSGGEDFALTVKRPVAQVAAPFTGVDLPAEARVLFPGLKVDRSRPSDNEVLYTFPVDGKDPGTVRLVFESAADGKQTVVHATVEVPHIEANIGGVVKVVSEAKVERKLKQLIENSISGLEAGSSGDSARREFSELLTVLAIATNTAAMNRAQALIKDPAKAALAMAALGGGDYFGAYDAAGDAETVDRPVGRGDAPMEDPNDRLADEAWQRERAEARAERALDANAAANDDTSGAYSGPGSGEY